MLFNKRVIVFLTIFCLLIFGGCKRNSSDYNAVSDADTSKVEEDAIKKAKNIFYLMYLPSEMYKVFEKAGAMYNPSILNPVENVNQYAASSKAAMNLGVYGVDLSYNKIFSQNQKTLIYFAVIHRLSQQLGIPDYEFASVLKKIEKNINNKDSLTFYASEIYRQTNQFLNENERQATATLIIMGGWIEALYIASKISVENVSNKEIIERIAFQKYSLRSLISLLNNYVGDNTVVEYLLMLKSLKQAFDNFEIYYEPGDLNIDTINKMVSANKIHINLTKENIAQINQVINDIRKQIVN